MDEQHEQLAEAKKLAKLLNCDELSSFTDLILLVQRFSGEGSSKRLQLVLQQFLDERDKPVSINVLQKEAIALNEIFPDHPVIDILNYLREFQYEETRVRIVVRKLLKEGNSSRSPVKRTSSFMEEASVEKKPKIVTCAEAANSGIARASTSKEADLISSSQSEKNTSSFDSQATIIYPLDTNEFMLFPDTSGKTKDEFVEESLQLSEKVLTVGNGERESANEMDEIKIEYPSSTVRDPQTEEQDLPNALTDFSSVQDPPMLTKKVRFDVNDYARVPRSYSEPVSSLERQPPKTILKYYKYSYDDMSGTIRKDPQATSKLLNGNKNKCFYPFPPMNLRSAGLSSRAFASSSPGPLKFLLPCENTSNEPTTTQNQAGTNNSTLILDKLNPPSSGSDSSSSSSSSSNSSSDDDSNVILEKENKKLVNENANENVLPEFVLESPFNNLFQSSDSEGSSGVYSDSSSRAKRIGWSVNSIIKKPSTVTQPEKLILRLPEQMPSSSTFDVEHFQAGPMFGKAVRRRSVDNVVEMLRSVSSTNSAMPTNEEMEGEYNLYNHLQEMFTDIPRDTIRVVCERYPVNVYNRPGDTLFNIIVSDLLTEQLTTDESDERIGQNSDTVSAAINAVVDRFKEVPNHLPSKVGQTNQPSTSSSNKRPVKRPFGWITSDEIIAIDSLAPDDNFLKEDDLNAVLIDLSKKNNEDLDLVTVDMDENKVDTDEDEVERVADDDAPNVDNTLVYPLMEMFPQACPTYIRRLCAGKTNGPIPTVLDDLISEILAQDNYPKRQRAASPEHKMEAEEQLEMLKQIFPDADPGYLQIHCDRLIDKPDEMKIFISNLLESRNYPTMKDYLRKQQISAQQKQYTSEFKVENFLEVIPDPATYFSDPKRKGAIVDDESVHYAVCYLRNQFCRISIRLIRDIVRKHDRNFLAAYKELETVDPQSYMKSRRAGCQMPQLIHNIPLLQEIAYLDHRVEIENYLKLKKVQEAEEKQAAKEAGLLQTCNCCFDDEVMPKDIYKCEEGCAFCKECVLKGCEVAFGDGKLDFLCLNNCSSHFSLQTLQAVLNPKMFSKIALKKQVEEVKAAGLSDLEQCPFCEFMTIPAKEDKLFRCLNPECMKESCRLCKEPSHLPLRCEEVEKEDDVKIRTYIENKMTEALLRKCYKCGMKFIKADGCNKMTCSCGALMCYVCNQPVTDYKHFNGPGGDRFDLCPLYNDTNNFHEQAVLQGAEEAKKELGVDSLKIDPTVDVAQHYDEIKKKNPVVVPPYANPPLDLPRVMLHPNINPNPGIFLQNAERQIARIRRMHHHHRHHHHPQNPRQRDGNPGRHHHHHRDIQNPFDGFF